MFRNLLRFNPAYVFSTWLVRFGINYGIDFLRRQRLKTISLYALLLSPEGQGYFEERTMAELVAGFDRPTGTIKAQLTKA